jgi:hypothetical protein
MGIQMLHTKFFQEVPLLGIHMGKWKVDGTTIWKLNFNACCSVHLGNKRKYFPTKRVTAVLLSIPKEAFADSFQKLYERSQPCVVKYDDYVEGQ